MMLWSWAKVSVEYSNRMSTELTLRCQDLEDTFDGENRRNPRNFIVLRHSIEEKDPKDFADAGTIINETLNPESNITTYATQVHDLNDLGNHPQAQLPSILRRRNIGPEADGNGAEDGSVTEKTQDLVFFDEVSNKTTHLARIPTCAIFHKLTSGSGVPHSFYGMTSHIVLSIGV